MDGNYFGNDVFVNDNVLIIMLETFRLDYEYEVDYEYNFRLISNQWHFQSLHTSCWFYVGRVAHGMNWVYDVIM